MLVNELHFLFFFVAYYDTNYRTAFQMDYRTLVSPSITCQSNYIAQLNANLVSVANALTSLCASITPTVTVSPAANINPVAVVAYSDGVSIITTLCTFCCCCLLIYKI